MIEKKKKLPAIQPFMLHTPLAFGSVSEYPRRVLEYQPVFVSRLKVFAYLISARSI